MVQILLAKIFVSENKHTINQFGNKPIIFPIFPLTSYYARIAIVAQFLDRRGLLGELMTEVAKCMGEFVWF